MGFCYQEKGQKNQALTEFEKAYRATPRSSTCLLTLGTAYLDMGDLESAARYLAHALELAEREYRKGSYAKDPSNLLNACLFLSKASRSLAAKSLQFGLRKFPNHPLLKQELGSLTGKLVA
jgi:tetratricopeptide (TPR) repeat protein